MLRPDPRGDCFFRSRLHPGSLLADRTRLVREGGRAAAAGGGIFRSGGEHRVRGFETARRIATNLERGGRRGGREEMSSTLLFPAGPGWLRVAGVRSSRRDQLPGHVRVGRGRPPQPLILEPDVRPKWHDDRRELWLGPVLVKRFRFRSPNQEMLLTAFEEEQWPIRPGRPAAAGPEPDQQAAAPRRDQEPEPPSHDASDPLRRRWHRRRGPVGASGLEVRHQQLNASLRQVSRVRPDRLELPIDLEMIVDLIEGKVAIYTVDFDIDTVKSVPLDRSAS